MKKKIGITFTTTNFENYLNWFDEDDLGETFELVTLSFEQNNIEDINQCDGFVLTGGVDIHPSRYSGNLNYPNQPQQFQEDRDQFEARVYWYAKQHRLPLLGICRGMQLVYVLEGGQMVQDLGEAKNQIHKKTAQDKKHSISIVENSLLQRTTLVQNGAVNSAHHQSIDASQMPDSLRAVATAADATIEAIEYKNPSDQAFMLCVQWHPERMEEKNTNPVSINIKKAFLNAINNTLNMKMNIINPATAEIIADVTKDDVSSLNEKLKLLQTGQKNWSKVSLQDRIAVINQYSNLLAENLETLANTLTAEVGKPIQQSRNEINGSRSRIEWLTNHAEKYLQEEIMQASPGMTELIRYEPLGIICNISAWNYPYLVGTNVFVPALLAGNAVLYKPSEHATLTGLMIEKLLKQAGLPDDVFQVAIGGKETGETLLSLPLDGYFFTGSYQTGKYIYEKVAGKMVPCQCELGGKDPLYITEDIDNISAIAAGTADGAFYNNGQSCCAVERIYVNEKVYDQYVDAFVKEVQSWKLGNPMEDGIYLGAVSRESQIEYLEQQVADAIAKGATLLTGGKRVDSKGYYFEPTVLINVNHDMLVMREESFGPIIGIMKVKDDAEALALMNDTDYGLTASVYSRDRERAETILSQTDAGTGYWNCCDRVSAALPWSGRRHSGFGATLSHAGIRAFTQPKAFHLRG